MHESDIHDGIPTVGERNLGKLGEKTVLGRQQMYGGDGQKVLCLFRQIILFRYKRKRGVKFAYTYVYIYIYITHNVNINRCYFKCSDTINKVF